MEHDKDNCDVDVTSGISVVMKLRQMGFGSQELAQPFEILCRNCTTTFQMTTCEFACPECGHLYGVVPCHADSVDNVAYAGKL